MTFEKLLQMSHSLHATAHLVNCYVKGGKLGFQRHTIHWFIVDDEDLCCAIILLLLVLNQHLLKLFIII